MPVAISYCSGLAQGWVEELRRIELLTCVVYSGNYQPEWLPLRYIHYSAVAEMARKDGPTGHLMFTKFCGRMPEDRHLAPWFAWGTIPDDQVFVPFQPLDFQSSLPEIRFTSLETSMMARHWPEMQEVCLRRC